MSVGEFERLIHEQYFEEITQVILSVQDFEVENFGVAAVGTGDKCIAVRLDFEEAGRALYLT